VPANPAVARLTPAQIGVALLLLFLTACQSLPRPDWHWARAEDGLPRQAIALSLAVDPDQPDRLWVGYYAPGGLATSQDRGQSWSVSGSDQPGLADNPIFDLLPAGKGTGLWAATRDGLLYSPNNGGNWQPISAIALPSESVFALAADARGRLYLGLDDAGLYAQAEAGEWQSLAPDEPLARAAVLSLAVATDGQRLYAGTAQHGLFASQDGGQSWVNTYPGHYVPNVALNPTNPNQAVASLRDRLVRTLDGGQSWHTLPMAWAREGVFSLLWLADGTLGAGAGQGQIYRSLDGGTSWLAGAALPNRGAVLDLAVTGERILAGAWTGLYASDDGGQSWSLLAPSLGKPNAHALLNTPGGLLLGSQAGLYRWQSDSQKWEPASSNFPQVGVASLALAPSAEQTIYAGTTIAGVYRSEDGGQHWQELPSLRVGTPALAVDPTEPDRIFMLAAWERVYESTNRGELWLARWEGLGVTTEAVSLALDPQAQIAYLGGDTGLYRSRDSEPWQWVAPALADQSVLALMTQPLPPSLGGGTVLYIGTTRGVYRSLDNGQTVQPSQPGQEWGQGLADVSVTAFLVDPADPRYLLAGTAYQGVYESTDWGRTWQAIGPAGLAEEVIEALAWGPEGELFVAAAGGVWRGVRLVEE
jgi:ligand-binding sensor domain-containing protein